MSAADRAIRCSITWRHDWAPHLFSFRTARPAGFEFVPGQFVRIGVDGADGAMVWRAYSVVSTPADDHLEFYSIVVPDGPFTQPLSRLVVGDSIQVDPTVYGFLRTDRFAGGRQLWLLATGTGIAPFVSMLADPFVWGRFENIVVVHSVRRGAELAYRERFAAWSKAPPAGGRLTYRPTLTADAPQARISALLADGRLERELGLAIAADLSRVMICGNPSMIKDVRVLLGARGLTPVRRETPGQYIAENFW